ncbi:MAG: hypothetical protein QM607_08965 [Microbacterium sp.]
MDFDFASFVSSIAQVLIVGLLFGAGLPALFAVGMRSLASAPAGATVDPNAEHAHPTAAGRAGAIVCFGLCGAVALFGIVVIVFGKQLFG